MVAGPLSRILPLHALICVCSCHLQGVVLPFRASSTTGTTIRHDLLERIKQTYDQDPWIQASKANLIGTKAYTLWQVLIVCCARGQELAL